jgi:8-oxo-dGTP diphosphatase
MKKYVVSFILTPDFKYVWLIKKKTPEWQKDCLNGIGGKIELGETPKEAIIRELQEESGLILQSHQLISIGIMRGINNDNSEFQVDIFTGVTNEKLVTKEEESIDVYKVSEVKDHKHIENIPMLIETCIYRLSGHSHFHRIVMDYNHKLRFSE